MLSTKYILKLIWETKGNCTKKTHHEKFVMLEITKNKQFLRHFQTIESKTRLLRTKPKYQYLITGFLDTRKKLFAISKVGKSL